MVAHAGKPLNIGDMTQPLSAAADNLLPRGELGRKQVVSDSAGTTSSELIAQETVTVLASREIHVEAHGTVRGTAATGAFARLYEDGNQIDRKNFWIPATATDISYSIKITRRPSEGPHTYSLQTGVSGGGGATVHTIADDGTGVHGMTEMVITDQGTAY